jgi:large subunit ribosomal protein L20
MPRSTNAPASRKRRSARLKKARGFRGGRSKLFRTATEAVDRAECMATDHRRTRKRDFRRLWITRISAAVKPFGLNYSTFMNGANKAGVELNRKMLSEIAIHDPEGFEGIVTQAKAALS